MSKRTILYIHRPDDMDDEEIGYVNEVTFGRVVVYSGDGFAGAYHLKPGEHAQAVTDWYDAFGIGDTVETDRRYLHFTSSAGVRKGVVTDVEHAEVSGSTTYTVKDSEGTFKISESHTRKAQ